MIRNPLILLLLISALQTSLARGEDLVTRDGTVYHDYKVLSHDAGFLTIMYSDGGGKIPLSNLPDDLQKKYGYNKQQADAAVQAAIAQDRQDRQALSKQEAAHQQQLAIQAQTQTAIEATPAVSRPSVPSAASIPAPAPAMVNAPSPPTNIQPGSTAQTTTPVTPQDIAGLKKKISALQDEIAKVKMGDTELVIGSDPYTQQLSAFNNQLAVLRYHLNQMEIDLPKKTLGWDDVSRVHSQIVDLEDDMARCEPESSSDDLRARVNASDKIENDTEEIAELRQTLEMSPKEPLTLSPGEVADRKQRMADLKSEIEHLATTTSDPSGDDPRVHQTNNDTEEYSLLEEELTASGNP